MLESQRLIAAIWSGRACGAVTMPLARDLLHPSLEEEKKKHKKRLVQSPNSYFMDVKCPGKFSNFLVLKDVSKKIQTLNKSGSTVE